MTKRSTLPCWVRVALSAISAVFFAAFLVQQGTRHGYEAADLTAPLLGARALFAGQPPYTIGPPVADQLLYPVPALFVVAPLAWLPLPIARAVWGGLAAALITFVGLSRFGVHGAALLLSRCAERAIGLAQWSPLFLAGAVLGPVQFIAAAKPTIALIVFAYRPTRWAVIGAAVLLPLAFLMRPTWLGEWWAATRSVSYYAPAVAVWRGGGPLLLLAALRWRRPEGRLLLALACVPHNFVWYDQLLLFLVPQRPWQVWMLTALSWVSTFVGWHAIEQLGIPEPAGQVAFRAPIVALMYLPALALTLSRPNAGTLPAWLERRIASWPHWVRGRRLANA